MKCLLWSVFTSLPQVILAVPSFLFVETFTSLLPFGAAPSQRSVHRHTAHRCGSLLCRQRAPISSKHMPPD